MTTSLGDWNKGSVANRVVIVACEIIDDRLCSAMVGIFGSLLVRDMSLGCSTVTANSIRDEGSFCQGVVRMVFGRDALERLLVAVLPRKRWFRRRLVVRSIRTAVSTLTLSSRCRARALFMIFLNLATFLGLPFVFVDVQEYRRVDGRCFRLVGVRRVFAFGGSRRNVGPALAFSHGPKKIVVIGARLPVSLNRGVGGRGWFARSLARARDRSLSRPPVLSLHFWLECFFDSDGSVVVRIIQACQVDCIRLVDPNLPRRGP